MVPEESRAAQQARNTPGNCLRFVIFYQRAKHENRAALW
jgi:hypothetical protein